MAIFGAVLAVVALVPPIAIWLWKQRAAEPVTVQPDLLKPSSSGWRQAVTALAVLATLGVAGGYVVGLIIPTVVAWDDTVYPQEIPSISNRMAFHDDEFLKWTFDRPKALWTTQIGDRQANIVGGNSTIVLLQSGTHLLGLDMRTGKQHWPFIDLHDAAASCAVREHRIGCVAPASNGSDSTVFILDTGSGQILRTVKVPNQELRSIVVSGDRFIAMTAYHDDKGFAVGYTTQGDQVWTHEGHNEMYVSASQGILVDTAHDAKEVVFVSTANGREVVRSKRPQWRGGRDLAWNVFRGGIAIQNENWTGTDIYDLDGKKKSSVAGWEPAGSQYFGWTSSPLPLLNRLGEGPPHYPDLHTIAAANPETGHLLWRMSGRELSTRVATVGDKLIVKVADPEAPDFFGKPKVTGREFVRVYNCFTGETLSPPIDMTRTHVEQSWIRSDGYNLVYRYIEDSPRLPNTPYTYMSFVVVGYDIKSGARDWELPLEGEPAYIGGNIVAVSTRTGVVSLFR